MPVNPRRWPAFTAGSSVASDMIDIKDKLQTPLDNLRVAKEYIYIYKYPKVICDGALGFDKLLKIQQQLI